MNDYWNDPPEEPEAPECCGEEMEFDDDWVATCKTCGRVIEPPEDIGPPPPDPLCETCGKKYPCDCEIPYELAECPHGNRPGDCDACDYLSDLAFDAARESR